MALKPIGKVYKVSPTFGGKADIIVQLTAPLSVGDTITFDSWQEGVTNTVTNLVQNKKQVTSASSGQASIQVSGSVPNGVDIYKVIAGESNGAHGRPEGTGGANQPSQGGQNLGVVLPGAPSMFTTVTGIYNTSRDAPSMQTNLAATGTEFLKYTPSYAQSIKAKPMSAGIFYIIAVLLLFLPIIILFVIYNLNSSNNTPAVMPPRTQIFATLLFSFVAFGLLFYVGSKNNLNKMQGTFTPYNAQPLKSPISNAATFMQTNLAATGTEFLKYTPSYAQSIKAKPMSTGIFYIIAVLLLFLPIIILFYIYNPNSSNNTPAVMPPMTQTYATLLFSFVASGLILLYVGFKVFSRDQLLSSTPVSRIDVATYNLNKMQGTFMPYNAQPLKSPISNADCIHFAATIYAVFYTGEGRYRRINIVPVGSIGKGVPALFTDGSGYLAVDLQKAPDVHAAARLIEVIPKNKNFGASVAAAFGDPNPEIERGRQIAEEIMPLLSEAAKSNTSANLLQLQDFDFKPRFAGKIINLKGGIQGFVRSFSFMGSGFTVFILETYIPSGSTYTCLGGAADIGKSIDNKPVKVFVPDQRSGVMAVHSGEAQKVTKGMSKQSIISLAFGALLLIGALPTAASYISYAQTQHSALATLSTTIPATPISTTIPTTTQQSSITITSWGSFASCANASVFEPLMDAEASATCNWTGGSVAVYAGGGNSGYASVKIIGSNNQTYFSKSTDSWCPTQIGSVYLPAQKYTILLRAGSGGGSCSNNPSAVAYLK
ncbi:MAG: hypothetical protein QW530_02460 [Candidatus Micrarchaeaceae archaeon]